MQFNDTSVRKIKQIEHNNINIVDVSKNLEYEREELLNGLKLWKEKFENEQNHKIKYKNELDNFSNRIKILLTLIRNFYENGKANKITENDFFDKIKMFYQSDYRKEGKENLNKNSNFFNNYDNY
jgi:hypothetical protein